MIKLKAALRKKFKGKYIISTWETVPCEEKGEMVIHVGLAKGDLTAPEIADLPAEIEGVSIVYHYEGTIKPLTTQYYNPVIGGVSIGAIDITAGTNGGIVWDKRQKPYMLTNEHIVSDMYNSDPNHPPDRHKIVQPGIFDGGTELVGHLKKVGGMKDAALNGKPCEIDAALIDPARDIDDKKYYDLGGVDPQDSIEAQPGEEVVKVGRTTGVTHGIVHAVDVSVNIWGHEWAEYILMEGVIHADPFLEAGDSGSRVWRAETMEPAGLAFAGSERSSFVIPAQTICKKFSVYFKQPKKAKENPFMFFLRKFLAWLKRQIEEGNLLRKEG